MFLSRKDVPSINRYLLLGRYPECVEEGLARVRLRPETLKNSPCVPGDDDPVCVVRVEPPAGYQGTADEWLRSACRALGQDAPQALPQEAFERVMKEASHRARSTLGVIRERFLTGLPEDHSLSVKLNIPKTTEYVWVEVQRWKDGVLTGTLTDQPRSSKKYKQGQMMRIPEADVFDRVIISLSKGMVEPSLTDIVALDFGMDVG